MLDDLDVIWSGAGAFHTYKQLPGPRSKYLGKKGNRWWYFEGPGSRGKGKPFRASALWVGEAGWALGARPKKRGARGPGGLCAGVVRGGYVFRFYGELTDSRARHVSPFTSGAPLVFQVL